MVPDHMKHDSCDNLGAELEARRLSTVYNQILPSRRGCRLENDPVWGYKAPTWLRVEIKPKEGDSRSCSK